MGCNCDVVNLRINSIIHFIGVDYLKHNLLGVGAMNRHHHHRLCPVGRAREGQIKQCRGLSCGKLDTGCKYTRLAFLCIKGLGHTTHCCLQGESSGKTNCHPSSLAFLYTLTSMFTVDLNCPYRYCVGNGVCRAVEYPESCIIFVFANLCHSSLYRPCHHTHSHQDNHCWRAATE